MKMSFSYQKWGCMNLLECTNYIVCSIPGCKYATCSSNPLV